MQHSIEINKEGHSYSVPVYTLEGESTLKKTGATDLKFVYQAMEESEVEGEEATKVTIDGMYHVHVLEALLTDLGAKMDNELLKVNVTNKLIDLIAILKMVNGGITFTD